MPTGGPREQRTCAASRKQEKHSSEERKTWMRMPYSEPVEGRVTNHRVLRDDETDWEAVAQEFKDDPNTWRVLKIDKYRECSDHMAKYARKQLRKQGLETDKIRHYEEYAGVPDPVTGEPEVLRRPLDIYSVHAMYSAPEKETETDG
jgi:hypothetical protein